MRIHVFEVRAVLPDGATFTGGAQEFARRLELKAKELALANTQNGRPLAVTAGGLYSINQEGVKNEIKQTR